MRKKYLVISLIAFASIAVTNKISSNRVYESVKAEYTDAIQEVVGKETNSFVLNEFEKGFEDFDLGEGKDFKGEGKIALERDGLSAFAKAVKDFKPELEKYINVKAMNVENRDLINLPDFDYNYVPPTYSQVAIRMQNDFYSKLSRREKVEFENLRQNYYEIDKFNSMVENEFAENYQTKYYHSEEHRRGGDMVAQWSSLASLLVGAGLGAKIIAEFKAIVIAIKAAIASSGIPFIGWVLMAAALVVALVTLTILIIQVWNALKTIWPYVSEWFHTTFPKAAKYFDEYFAVTDTLVVESVTITVERVGDRDMEFQEVSVTDIGTLTRVKEASRQNGYIYLMSNISSKSFMIALNYGVDFEFCVLWQTHTYFSSYTYNENTARNLIVCAGNKLTTFYPEIHVPDHAGDVMMFHFHNYERGKVSGGAGQTYVQTYPYQVDGARRCKDNPLHWVHSFCGEIEVY